MVRVRHNDNVLGQLFYTSVDDRTRLVFYILVIFRKSKAIAQQPQHIVVSICRALYRNAVCTVACDNRAFLQATLQLAPVLDEQAAGKVCLALEFQRTSVLVLIIVIYEDSRDRRSCRLGNRCIIADDQLAALYIQSRSALNGQAVPIHHECNGFVDRLLICIFAEADHIITGQRFQHRHRAAICNACKGVCQIEIMFAVIILCLHLLFALCDSVGSRRGHLGYRFCGRFAVLRRIRFLRRSFLLLLLLLLLLHDGVALRRVRFRRPCGGGQERQAQSQRHECTQ